MTVATDELELSKALLMHEIRVAGRFIEDYAAALESESKNTTHAVFQEALLEVVKNAYRATLAIDITDQELSVLFGVIRTINVEFAGDYSHEVFDDLDDE